MLRYLIIILCTANIIFPYPVNAETGDRRFCVFPIKNGTPTKADVNSTWRMVNTKVPLSGYGYPIFTPLNRRGVWTINENREWIKFDGVSPTGYLDSIKKEPWTGRTVVVRMHGDEDKVLALEKESEEFKVIDRAGVNSRTVIDGKILKSFSGPYVLESRKETLVQSGGVPYLLSRTKLESWPDTKSLEKYGISNIFSIYDAPALGGIIILTRDWSLYLYNDGIAQKLTQFSDEVYGHLINIIDTNSAVFLLQKSVYLFKINNQTKKIDVRRLAKTKARGAAWNYRYLEQFNQVIRYNPDLKNYKYKLEKLTASGFAPISDIQSTTSGINKSNTAMKIEVMGMITDIPRMSLAIFKDSHNISIYNGDVFTNVINNYKELFGGFVNIIPLPSIQKIIISSIENGSYELKPSGEIKKIDFKINVEGLPRPEFIDWPSANSALMITSDGAYVLDKDLNVSRVEGGDRLRPEGTRSLAAFIPAVGDVVLKTRKGLVSIIDTDKSGQELCDSLNKNP